MLRLLVSGSPAESQVCVLNCPLFPWAALINWILPPGSSADALPFGEMIIRNKILRLRLVLGPQSPPPL